MTVQFGPGGRRDRGSRIDAGRLWAGGAATALVAALIAVVGVLIAHGLFDVPTYKPSKAPTLAVGSTSTYAWVSALAALLATGLMHLLLLAAPQPIRFFGWIMFLLVAAVTLTPFTVEAPDDVQIASSLINLAVGVAIASLVVGVARTAVRPAVRPAGPGPYPDPYRYGRPGPPPPPGGPVR